MATLCTSFYTVQNYLFSHSNLSDLAILMKLLQFIICLRSQHSNRNNYVNGHFCLTYHWYSIIQYGLAWKLTVESFIQYLLSGAYQISAFYLYDDVLCRITHDINQCHITCFCCTTLWPLYQFI
jgi:hypothetical protein